MQDCGKRLAEQLQYVQLQARERQNERRCRRRGATSDSSEQTGNCSNSQGWRSSSLGRLWRGSRSSKRAFCRSLGPKQAVVPALRDGRVTLPWVATAFFAARRRVPSSPTLSRQAACTRAISSRKTAPPFSLFVCADGNLKRHPSSESVHRVGTGVKALLRPKRCRARNFGIPRSEPEPHRHRRIRQRIGGVPREDSKPLEKSAALWLSSLGGVRWLSNLL